MRIAVAAWAAAVALACSSASGNGSGSVESARLDIFGSVEAGGEATFCRWAVVGRDLPAGDVVRIEHFLGSASHHLFLYESTESGPTPSEPFRCDDDPRLHRAGLLHAGQEPAGALELPPTLARRLDPGRVLLMEWHVVGTRGELVDARASLTFDYSRTPVRSLVGTLSYYQPFIHVPPRAGGRATLRCELPGDVRLLWATGHMHRRGTKFSARLISRDERLPVPLFETHDWDSPGIAWLGDGVAARRGDVVEYECEYQNRGDRDVIEGASAEDDEMCMFFAGYHPRLAVPLGESCSGSGSGPVFHGDRTCAESLRCLRVAGSDVDRERCWVATSAEAGAALVDLALRCATARCAAPCTGGHGADCDACLSRSCPVELSACVGSPAGGAAVPAEVSAGPPTVH